MKNKIIKFLGGYTNEEYNKLENKYIIIKEDKGIINDSKYDILMHELKEYMGFKDIKEGICLMNIVKGEICEISAWSRYLEEKEYSELIQIYKGENQ